MNHFSDNDEKTLDLQKAKTPHVIMPQAESNAESLEPRTAEAIEANIDRLAAGTPGVADRNVSNFDTLEFARLSSGLSSNELPDGSVIAYAEADPYVDPAELNQAPSMNVNETETRGTHLTHPITPAKNAVDPMSEFPPTKTVDEILKTISGYEEEIETPDPALEAVRNDSPTLHEPENPAGPAVEVIGSSEEFAAEMPMAQMTSSDTVGSELPPGEKLPAGMKPPVDEELTPVSWFAKPTGLPDTTVRKTAISNSSRPALPVVNPGSGEPIYDIRDFSSSASGVIEPIPGAFKVEPDLADCQTIDNLATLQPSNAPITDRPHGGEPDAFAATVGAQQLFMAGSGDVIEIDGNDGFDYIDLACFDVNLATFFDDVIDIDDQQGCSFRIHYKNVKHALFADDLEVDLKYEPSEDETTGN